MPENIKFNRKEKEKEKACRHKHLHMVAVQLYTKALNTLCMHFKYLVIQTL